MKPFLIVVFSLLFAGCGSGSGGGTSSSAHNSSQPSNSQHGSIIFSEKDDSFSALPFSLMVTENLQQLAQTNINTLTRFITEGQTELISNQKKFARISFEDNDKNIAVSANDKITIHYVGVEDYENYSILKANITGDVIVLLSSLAHSDNDLHITGTLDYTNSEPVNNSV